MDDEEARAAAYRQGRIARTGAIQRRANLLRGSDAAVAAASASWLPVTDRTLPDPEGVTEDNYRAIWPYPVRHVHGPLFPTEEPDDDGRDPEQNP